MLVSAIILAALAFSRSGPNELESLLISSRWNYERPYFYAEMEIQNISTRAAQSARIQVTYTDTLRRKIVGISTEKHDLRTNPLGPREHRGFSVQTHAPDILLYLAQNRVPFNSIKGDVEIWLYDR